MPRQWVLWALFLSSYLPLFGLLGLRAIGESYLVASACAILVVLGVIGTVAFLKTAGKKVVARYEVIEVENRDADVSAYAGTYLLPFLAVFGGRWQDIASLGAFIAFLGVVYVRSRLIYVNPILSVLGFRLWRVIAITAGSDKSAVAGTWPRFALARAAVIAPGDVVEARRVTSDLLLIT